MRKERFDEEFKMTMDRERPVINELYQRIFALNDAVKPASSGSRPEFRENICETPPVLPGLKWQLKKIASELLNRRPAFALAFTDPVDRFFLAAEQMIKSAGTVIADPAKDNERWDNITVLKAELGSRHFDEVKGRLAELSAIYPDHKLKELFDDFISALTQVINSVKRLVRGAEKPDFKPVSAEIMKKMNDALERISKDEKAADDLKPGKEVDMVTRLGNLIKIYKIETYNNRPNSAADADGNTYCIELFFHKTRITGDDYANPNFPGAIEKTRDKVKEFIRSSRGLREGYFNLQDEGRGGAVRLYDGGLNIITMGGERVVFTQKKEKQAISILIGNYIQESEHKEALKAHDKLKCGHDYCRAITGRSPETLADYSDSFERGRKAGWTVRAA